MCTRLLMTAAVFLALQAVSSGEAAQVFTDRDLQRYEIRQESAGADTVPTGEGDVLSRDVETWLNLSEIENLIEQTKGERDRSIARLSREMEAERMQCTGIVGVEYWSGNSAHGYLVNATAKKNCELAVERKYAALIGETRAAAEERIRQLSIRKEEIGAGHRGHQREAR